jgi:hypothetical protein
MSDRVIIILGLLATALTMAIMSIPFWGWLMFLVFLLILDM